MLIATLKFLLCNKVTIVFKRIEDYLNDNF